MEAIDLDAVEIPRDVLDLLSPSVVNIYRIVPVRFDRDADVLTVAMADPKNVAALEDLRFMLGCFVSPLAADDAAVSRAIEKYYSSAWRFDMLDELIAHCESCPESGLRALRRRAGRTYHALAARLVGLLPFRSCGRAAETHRMRAMAQQEPSAKLVHTMLLVAIGDGVANAVLELSEEGGKFCFDLENEFKEIRSLTPEVGRLATRRIRRMADMEPDPETGVDRGTIQLNLLGRDFECRVECETREDGERLRLELTEGPSEQPG